MSHFIVGDWGTSNLRLHLICDGEVTETRNGRGIKMLQGNAKEYIYSLCKDWAARFQIKEVYLCGMAGSRIGIIETEYLDSPLGKEDYFNKYATFEYEDLVFKQSFGVKCYNPSRTPDVMRGEEMQIFGALKSVECQSGLFILPGTHSKWVKVINGQIYQFQTFPTGEFFDLLQNNSTLGNKDAAFDYVGFMAGIEHQVHHQGFLGGIFGARTYQLIENKSADWAKGFLSGTLIASEILQNGDLIAEFDNVTLVGAKKLCDNYSKALEKASIEYEILDGDLCALNGLLQFADYGT